MENFTAFTNKEILSGCHALVFQEFCDAPTDAKYVDDCDPRYTLYYDPDGLDYREIVCTTTKHRIRFSNCVLRFPAYPNKRDAKAQGYKEAVTYRCTSYTVIRPKFL